MKNEYFIENTERKKGTEYLEFQICRKNIDTNIDDLIDTKKISFWEESSLHVNLEQVEEFINVYGCYFDNGIHADKTKGELDIFGINYYPVDKAKNIIKAISKDRPKNLEKLLTFLKKAENENGFYILGI